MRIAIAVVISLAVLTAIGVFLGPKAVEMIQDRMPKPDSTVVRLANPERGDLVELIQAPGEIEPKTNVEISARISARIIELPFEEGDQIHAGDVVVRLDAVDYQASLTAAEARRAADAARIEVAKARIEAQEASIAGTRAGLWEAKLDLDRQRGLLESRDISQSVVDSAEARVDQLQAQINGQLASLRADTLNLTVMARNLDVADADIARAQDQLSYTILASPISGTLTRLNAEVGELVVTGTMNNAGTVILEVADLTKMLLVAQVDEADVGGLLVGQQATVRINAYPDREFSGVVDFIALTHSRAGDGSKYYRTEILIDTQEEQIFSGLTADVEIETRRHADVLKIPSQAVLARPVDDLPLSIRDDNPDVDMTKSFANVAYRFIDGKTVVTPVTIGSSDLRHTVILSGLADEDRIVVGPFKVLESLEHDKEAKDEQVVQAEEEAEQRKQEEKADAASNTGNDDRGGDDPDDTTETEAEAEDAGTSTNTAEQKTGAGG